MHLHTHNNNPTAEQNTHRRYETADEGSSSASEKKNRKRFFFHRTIINVWYDSEYVCLIRMLISGYRLGEMFRKCLVTY